MPTTHRPGYPVVDPNPSFGKAIGNFNLRDWSNVALFTLSGFTFGWFGGSSDVNEGLKVAAHEYGIPVSSLRIVREDTIPGSITAVCPHVEGAINVPGNGRICANGGTRVEATPATYHHGSYSAPVKQLLPGTGHRQKSLPPCRKVRHSPYLRSPVVRPSAEKVNDRASLHAAVLQRRIQTP
ncbi:unnamed protein product [Sphagnum balticum]